MIIAVLSLRYEILIKICFFAFGFRTEELDAYSVMVQGICRRRSMSYN